MLPRLCRAAVVPQRRCLPVEQVGVGVLVGGPVSLVSRGVQGAVAAVVVEGVALGVVVGVGEWEGGGIYMEQVVVKEGGACSGG